MIDITQLEKKGCSAKAWEPLFTTKKPSDKIKALTDRHSARIQQSIELASAESPVYAVIDNALDAARQNLPHDQARILFGSGQSSAEVKQKLATLGLDYMLEQRKDATGASWVDAIGQPVYDLNVPVFEQVFIPLVAAYARVRTAKLFNDRNIFPRYKYTPARSTLPEHVAAEIVTNRIQQMTEEMAYQEDDRRSIKGMLHYGLSINFPMERWYKEEQIDGAGKMQVVREGVRFTVPHPTRQFWDRSQPLTKLNQDIGPQWCGYWDVVRWSDIRDNKSFWNRDKVSYGASYPFLTTNAWQAFATLYPCKLKWPTVNSTTLSNDSKQVWATYGTGAEADAACTQIVLFDRLIPKDNGLGDYDQPVWCRFIYGDTQTVLYAEPLGYSPACVFADDYDDTRSQQDSLALKLVPFQQLLGNFLTQHFLAVKSNLTRLVFTNTDLMSADTLTYLRGLKDRMYQGLHFVPFSKQQNTFLQQDQREAMLPVQFGALNTQDAAANINLVLAAVERMLGFSPAELGGTASHEISAKEASIIQSNNSTSLDYTGHGVDEGIAARKRVLYEAMMLYSSDEVFARVDDLNPEKEEALKELGFEIQKQSRAGGRTTAGVKGKKSALSVHSFMRNREGVNRVSDARSGIAMFQAVGQLMNNPMIMERVGPDRAIQLFNRILMMNGLPEDQQIPFGPAPEVEKAKEEAKQQMDGLVQQIMGAVDTKIKEAQAVTEQEIQEAAKILQQLMANDKQLAEQLKMLEGALVRLIQGTQGPPQPMMAPPPPPMPMVPPGAPPMMPPPEAMPMPMPPPQPMPPEAGPEPMPMMNGPMPMMNGPMM